MAALARANVWLRPHLRRGTAPLPSRRFDPRRPPPAGRRQALPSNPVGQRRRPTVGGRSAGQLRLAVRRASNGRPAGLLRLARAVPGSPAQPSGVSEPAATAVRTAVAAVITVIDVVAITVGHGEIAVTVATLAVVGSAVIAEISVITAIAKTTMTVDIVAPAGRGRHERAARTARAAAVFVDDEP